MRVLHVVSSPALWREELPELDPTTVDVKYELVAGEELGPAEQAHRDRVEALVERVRGADRIMLGVPMWNWSFPYKLKQFIDLVCLRDRLFTFDGDTYGPALDVPRALIVATRGQGRETGMVGPPPQPADHQVDFLRFWLQIIGVRDVDVVLVEHAWDGATAPSVTAAIEDVRRRAPTF